MQTRKSLLALTLVAVMLLSAMMSVFSVSAATYSLVEDKTKAYNIEEGMKYSEYTITSGVNGHVESASMIEFDTDDFIPMAFAGYSGTSGVLKTQYDLATKKYGYDVAAVMNGAFFSMDSGTPQYGNYGTLVGIVISNGKIASAHAGYSGEVVAFSSDGHFDVVNSNIGYTLNIDGKEIPNGIYYINKTSGSKVASAWKNNFYYYDTSCGRICDTYDVCRGYEIVCEKIDNTELVVGGTLRGKILEVKADSYGAKLAENTYDMSDKFVLFVKNDSTYANMVKELKADAIIEIGANEQIAASKEVMENASSVLSNVGWLVKDGVDRTQIDSTIGTHSVTLCARWNAFGVKEDGSYVFFTTEGKGTGNSDAAVTLQDVARAMIDAGCKNVIRMDGGGSVALYVKDDGTGNPGYKVPSNREVGDCILITRRPKADDATKAALDALIEEAEKALAGGDDDMVKAAYDEAVAVKASEKSTSGDFTRVIMKLGQVFSGNIVLADAINKAKTISYKDYSESEIKAIQEAYDFAVAVKNTPNATVSVIKEAADKLNDAINVAYNVTVGKPYTTTGSKHTTYVDEDDKTLTDGKYASAADGGDAAFAGYNGSPFTITVDLQGEYSVNEFKMEFLYQSSWGISAPNSVVFEYSADGKNWSEAGVATITGSGNPAITTATLKTEAAVTAKFLKATVKYNGWIFVSEFEAKRAKESISDVGYITAFNTAITSGAAVLFTPDVTKNLADSNVKWSEVLYLTWDNAKGGYKVVEHKASADSTVLGHVIEADQIAIGVNNGGDAVPGSNENRVYTSTAKIDDYIEFHGIYVENNEVYPGGYFKIVSAKDFNKEFSGKYTAKEYDIPTTGVKVTKKEFNLVPEVEYEKVIGGGTEVPSYSFKDGVMTISANAPGQWPSLSYVLPEPVVVDFETATIDIDVKVDGGATAILLYMNNGEYIKIHQNITDKYTSSGDIESGEFKFNGKVSDLKVYDTENEAGKAYAGKKPLVADENGNVTFTQIVIFACGTTNITVNSLKLNPDVGDDKPEEPSQPSEPDEEGFWKIFENVELVEVNGENGIFQNANECDLEYAFAATRDNDYFYLGLIGKAVPLATPDDKTTGNGNGSNVRIWFRTNKEATVYTHFIDVFYKGDFEANTFGKKNGSLTENKALEAPLDTSKVVAEFFGNEDFFCTQFKIPLSLIEAEGDVEFYVTVSNGGENNNALLYPKADKLDDDLNAEQPTNFFPYRRWNTAALKATVNSNDDPTTGDMGLVALAAVAVITLAGAVVIKKRK